MLKDSAARFVSDRFGVDERLPSVPGGAGVVARGFLFSLESAVADDRAVAHVHQGLGEGGGEVGVVFDD